MGRRSREGRTGLLPEHSTSRTPRSFLQASVVRKVRDRPRAAWENRRGLPASPIRTEEMLCPERTSPASKRRSVADVVTVRSYEVALDLTTGRRRLRLDARVVRFAATPGASTFIDLIARDGPRDHPQRRGRSTSREVFADSRIQLDGPRRRERARRRRRLPRTRTPARACTASSTRSTARSTCTRSSRCPTRAACSRCSSSPTSRRRSSSRSPRRRAWKVVSNSPTPEPVARRTRPTAVEAATWTFEPTPRISSYITALVAGPYEVDRLRADQRRPAA